MKKMFLALVCLAISTITAIGQTNAEIAEIIRLGREVNFTKHGVINPNLIYPNRMVEYPFADGTVRQYVIEKG